MINLWQLHVFLTVNETGSFSAAATRLHMTQPGVSQQIRALESYLGTKLFVRRGHGVELTTAGFDLLDPARRLINLSELTERNLMARRGEVSGRIRLGCSLLSGVYNFHPWIQDFRESYPDVSVQMEQMEPGEVIGGLRAQEIEGGLVLGRIRGRGLVHHKVVEDPITLAVPLNHAWTWAGEHLKSGSADGDGGKSNSSARADDDHGPPAVRPQALKEAAFILEHAVGEAHSDARRALSDALEERGVSLRDLKVALELPDPMSVACAVAQGLGVGFVPLSVARRLVGQVVPLRVEGFALKQHVYLIYDRKALHSPAAQAWWKFVGSRTGSKAAREQGDAQVRLADTPVSLQELSELEDGLQLRARPLAAGASKP